MLRTDLIFEIVDYALERKIHTRMSAVRIEDASIGKALSNSREDLWRQLGRGRPPIAFVALLWSVRRRLAEDGGGG